MIERYRYVNDKGCSIEIEAPKDKAQKFIDKYYPTFTLVDNFITKID